MNGGPFTHPAGSPRADSLAAPARETEARAGVRLQERREQPPEGAAEGLKESAPVLMNCEPGGTIKQFVQPGISLGRGRGVPNLMQHEPAPGTRGLSLCEHGASA